MRKRGKKKEQRDRIFLIRPLEDDPAFFDSYLDMVFSSKREAETFISKATNPIIEEQEFEVVEFIEL